MASGWTPMTPDSDGMANGFLNTNSVDAVVTVLKLGNQNMSQLIALTKTFVSLECPTGTSLGIGYSASGGFQVARGMGAVVSISVITASTSATLTGTVYDSATLVGLGSSAAIAVIPSSGVLTLNWPFTTGLVVQPSSAGQIVSVSYSQ